MKRSIYLWLCGICGLLLSWSASADPLPERFAAIAHANVFRLNPPPPDSKPASAEPATLKVTLRGVSSLCSPQAVLGIQTKIKPASAEEYCLLAPGQTHAGVTVRRIDMASATVWITNLGVEQVLTLRE